MEILNESLRFEDIPSDVAPSKVRLKAGASDPQVLLPGNFVRVLIPNLSAIQVRVASGDL